MAVGRRSVSGTGLWRGQAREAFPRPLPTHAPLPLPSLLALVIPQPHPERRARPLVPRFPRAYHFRNGNISVMCLQRRGV
jgi:hypothetical protein